MSHNNNLKLERLQKILSEAGVASRREAEKIILAGRVCVNGQVITQLGSKADPDRDKITFDGKRVKIPEKKVYYLFHKPMNVMVTRHDPEGRPTIYDYLKGIKERVNPVGRLDFDSEGLILLTNDGDLLARLTHPRHEISKIYQARIAGHLRPDELEKLRQGIKIRDESGASYVTQPCEVREIKKNPNNVWVEIVLKEGKNRQVRRMIEALGRGHQVLRLVRVGIGPLRLGELGKGWWRNLTENEIHQLKKKRD